MLLLNFKLEYKTALGKLLLKYSGDLFYQMKFDVCSEKQAIFAVIYSTKTGSYI